MGRAAMAAGEVPALSLHSSSWKLLGLLPGLVYPSTCTEYETVNAADKLPCSEKVSPRSMVSPSMREEPSPTCTLLSVASPPMLRYQPAYRVSPSAGMTSSSNNSPPSGEVYQPANSYPARTGRGREIGSPAGTEMSSTSVPPFSSKVRRGCHSATREMFCAGMTEEEYLSPSKSQPMKR